MGQGSVQAHIQILAPLLASPSFLFFLWEETALEGGCGEQIRCIVLLIGWPVHPRLPEIGGDVTTKHSTSQAH